MKTTRVAIALTLVSSVVVAGTWLWPRIANMSVLDLASQETSARTASQVDSTHGVVLKPIDILDTDDDSDLFGISGVLRRNQRQSQTFFLPKVADATFELIANGLRFEFRAPNGTTIVPGETGDLPGYQYFAAGPGLSAFQLANPPSGNWVVTATSLGSEDSIPYLITVGSFDLSRERAHLELLVGYSGPATVVDAHPNERVFVRAFLSRAGQLVTGGQWTLQIVRPDYAFEPLQVFDDGLHADGEPRDGVAVGSFALNHGPGVYDVVGKAKAQSGTSYSVGGSISVEHYHDLAVQGDILLDPPKPVAGSPVELLVNISNDGRVDSVAVGLLLYVNRTRVAEQRLTLNAGAARMVSTIWTPAAPGTYELRLAVDPAGLIEEITYENNSKVVTVTVAAQ